jgi:hypothetical protein
VDDIREELATRIIELAGEARSAMAQERRDQVLEALSRRAWLAAWEQGVRRATERVVAALNHAIAAAAHRVRMPQRQWRRRLLSGGERRAVHARLGSGAEHFVAALDMLDAAADQVRGASVLDKEAHAEWQESLRTAARRLEAAWLTLEDGLAAEGGRWAPEIEAIARWRLPLWPVLALWIPLAATLIWLGLIGGGYIASPLWLASRLGF